ncbi:AMP-binding protein, partial [Methanobrevibacter sp.]
DTAERFVNVFKEVLVQFLDKENLKDISYISNEDIGILDGFNDTEYDLDYVDVLDAFNDNLVKYPDYDLVSYKDKSYSYNEGAFVADKLASCLRALGVEVQDNVAFLVERSELYMFSVLGILSCGAVYVPLDDKLPDERFKFMLEDSVCRVVIVSDETYERAVALAADSIIFNISDILKEDIKKLDKLPVEYGDLACVLYTSGTTGIPKGVKLTRKAILNLSEFYIRTYGLSKDDVYGLFASIGFDVAIKGIFSSICSGAELCVVPNEIKLDMKGLNDYLLSHDVTHIEITTQVAKLFVSQVDVTSLKVMT